VVKIHWFDLTQEHRNLISCREEVDDALFKKCHQITKETILTQRLRYLDRKAASMPCSRDLHRLNREGPAYQRYISDIKISFESRPLKGSKGLNLDMISFQRCITHLK
jgi:hypothetical protein